MKKLPAILAEALENIRAHLFHTLLSMLGIVIGVAALTAILSLIDSMEQHARRQVNDTTTVKLIQINTVTHKMVQEVRMVCMGRNIPVFIE